MNHTIIKNYPILYKKDKSDKVRLWNINAIRKNNNTYWIATEYGHKDGKIIYSEKEITEGKNIGKKNETTIEQQLILICDKTFKDKKEKEEYIETLDDINNEKENKAFSPMLADKWNPESKTKRKVDIVFPCFIQPKLDGIRCLSFLSNDGEIVNQSRQLKHFKNLYHINKELDILLKKYPDLVLDGELYNHDIVFNQIAGIVKKEKYNEEDKEKLEQIQYHIYDCFFYKSEHEFSERNIFLSNAEKLVKWKYLKFVPTFICNDKNDVIHTHHRFVDDKYEGSILRNKSAFYEFTRSKNLQKFKNFEDDEFEIIGFKEGTGHDKGTVIWKCKAKNGKDFDVRPVGTVKERSDYLKNAKKCIGKMLTVTYQEISELGVPRFPVGKTIRDYE
jgi:ATP-dependent DNA ligase